MWNISYFCHLLKGMGIMKGGIMNGMEPAAPAWLESVVLVCAPEAPAAVVVVFVVPAAGAALPPGAAAAAREHKILV